MTCAKVKVECWIIGNDQQVYYGTNDVLNPQSVCPRTLAGETHGQGYEKCHHICQQPGHAEIMALAKAGQAARGGTALVTHDWVCPDCQAALDRAGIAKVVLLRRG